MLKLHNQKLARSLKKGCNDHIEELAIIKDKLVTSTVKQKSNKRPKTTLETDKSKKKRQTMEEKTDKSKKKGQKLTRFCVKAVLFNPRPSPLL